MKKLVWILLGVLTLWGCQPEDKPSGGGDSTKFTVSPTSLSFKEADNSTKFVSVTAGGAWTATVTGAWIHAGKLNGTGNGSISVKVDANEEENTRSGKITVSCGSQSASVEVTQEGSGKTKLVPAPAAYDPNNKLASTTYQLLVYSFADSNGDGWGDFKGIENKLDYLNDLGITALWLSPIHPSDSYHGYDVTDYTAVNPKFGTDADFQSLLEKAHAKGIQIYIDYVLNHSGKGHPWFVEALADAASPYRNYYFISSNPAADYGTFPMLTGTTYNSGEWKVGRTAGSPKITVRKTTDAETTGSSNWNLWIWPIGSDGTALKFKDNGDGTLYLVTKINGKYGLLLRRYDNWDTGSKFGAKSGKTLTEGTAMELTAEGGDLEFTGDGSNYRIEISDVSNIETLYFMGCFSDWMPDLNYGSVSSVESNACFNALASSADKWINMGIDGFRLDAVKHICGGIGSFNNSSNRTFLKKWYDRCNRTYKEAGHSDNIFMVGEVWSGHDEETTYYDGLTSCFEFGYWPLLYKALTSGSASSYVSTVSGFVKDHKNRRSDAQTALFLTNHDHSSQTGGGEVRAANDLGKDLAKEKQAAAMLLSSPGKPFIYQGEELGYWGDSRGKGDEYIRAPIVWNKSATDCAKKWADNGNKVDNSMLTGSISVESQKADANSLLTTYITWSRLRSTYPALASGEMTSASCNGGSVAAWYMTSGSQKLLVIHNVAAKQAEVSVSDSMAKPIAVLGAAYTKETKLILGPNSSVVFEL